MLNIVVQSVYLNTSRIRTDSWDRQNLCNWNDHIINDLVQMPIDWRRLCKGKGQVGSARAISTLESPPTIPDLAPIRWQNCGFRVVFCLRAFGTFCYLFDLYQGFSKSWGYCRNKRLAIAHFKERHISALFLPHLPGLLPYRFHNHLRLVSQTRVRSVACAKTLHREYLRNFRSHILSSTVEPEIDKDA